MEALNALVVALAVASVAYLVAQAYVRGYVRGLKDALFHLMGTSSDQEDMDGRDNS